MGVRETQRAVTEFLDLRIRRLRGLPVLPRTFCLAVTNRCNSRCAMCNIWRTSRGPAGSAAAELSLSEIQAFMSDTAFFQDLGFVYLSGGEPFLRDDLDGIVASIHGCQPACTVFIATNGFLTDRIVETVGRILAFHPRLQIGVSLDGIGAMHDAIRGVPGAFARTSATLHTLRDRYPQLHVQVTTTITPVNFRHIPQVYAFCEDHGFFSRIGMASTASYFQNTGDAIAYSREDLEEMRGYFGAIVQDVRTKRGRLRSLSDIFWLSESLRFLEDPTSRPVPCYSGFLSFYLSPQGTMYPCYNFFEAMGNVRSHAISAIWFSEKFQATRRKILDKRCPNCWIVHEAFPSMDSDYFRKFKYLFTSLQ
jgi:MoaA/NifB/PqqE/SkfB family radical SAM enzyme